MTTKTIDILEEQPQLSELLSFASAGNEVVIVEGAKPLARLIPVEAQAKKRVAGLNSGDIWISDDFDEPLPESFWAGPHEAI